VTAPRAVPSVGDHAPDFTAPTDGDGSLTLSALRGSWIVLFFYPRDDTPG
jgi:peroxiredoxin Q/BCP